MTIFMIAMVIFVLLVAIEHWRRLGSMGLFGTIALAVAIGITAGVAGICLWIAYDAHREFIEFLERVPRGYRNS